MQTRTSLKYEHNRICLNDNIIDNTITIDNIQYYMYYINPKFKNSKGAHSYVFALYEAQEYEDNPTPNKVIKISNNRDYADSKSKANNRFYREIEVLKKCQAIRLSNIVSIHADGQLWCLGKNKQGKSIKYYFPFYVMDYASNDLKTYLEHNDISISDRVNLCLQIAYGLNELYDLGYYHRDLKPDNILLFGNTWKIGDLGLVAFRDEDYDKMNEFIGPRGWITPEAMNKYLCEGNTGKAFDCKIDHQSDIFQLGKVFWYIIQGNAPIGTVKRRDYIDRNDEIYALLKFMLNHTKGKRPRSMEFVIKTLNRIAEKYY